MKRAAEIARKVTEDLGLERPLTALGVEVLLDPHTDSFLPPLHQYEEDWSATIESRLRQETDE